MLLLLATALAQTPLLAPTPPELLAAMAELEARLSGAEAATSALRRTHNAFAELLLAGPVPCEHAQGAALAARTPALGAGVRDRVQSARAQLVRVQALQASPTLEAVRDEAAIAALTARVSTLETGYVELQRWQSDNLSRWIRRCSPSLVVSEGLPLPLPVAAGEVASAVAVLGTGGGRICPVDLPADGRMVILPGGWGCYGVVGCGCEPGPLLPAAVLGRPQSGSAE